MRDPARRSDIDSQQLDWSGQERSGTCREDHLVSGACRREPSVLENVLNLAGRNERVRHRVGLALTGRRGRRLEAEAAEVAEIDQWLTLIRSGPEMVLYSAHPTSMTPTSMTPTSAPVTQAPARPARRAKKRRR